jgi:arsenate reductase-like glutaredoxin family protein
VDLSKGLSEKELDALIGSRDHKLFLNSRNELYRERRMKDHPPSRGEAIALMAQNPNLIRRPLLISGAQILFGFDQDEWKKIK